MIGSWGISLDLNKFFVILSVCNVCSLIVAYLWATYCEFIRLCAHPATSRSAVERWILSGSVLWVIYITELETICCSCLKSEPSLWHSDLPALIETVQKNDQKNVGVFCSRLFYCVLGQSLFGLLVNIFSKLFLKASAQKLRITFWVSMSQKVFQVVLSPGVA